MALLVSDVENDCCPAGIKRALEPLRHALREDNEIRNERYDFVPAWPISNPLTHYAEPLK